MRPIRRALLGAAAALTAGPALAIDWQYRILEATDRPSLNICTAGVYYDDGPFIVRVYGQTMDFFLADDDLALPPDRILGTVEFAFADASYRLQADSGSSEDGRPVDHLYLIPPEPQSEEILDRLRHSSSMEIVFPDGLTFTIDLAGSDGALIEAFECWRREGAGGRERDPSGSRSEQPQGTNPFR